MKLTVNGRNTSALTQTWGIGPLEKSQALQSIKHPGECERTESLVTIVNNPNEETTNSKM